MPLGIVVLEIIATLLLLLLKREEDILTVFDLGTVYMTGPCRCDIGHDHTTLKYHINPLEIFPQLQLFIAGWPLIGKIIRTYSATEVEKEHHYDYALTSYYEII